jgi:hypothetical protein
LRKKLAAIPGKKHFLDQENVNLSKDAYHVHVPSGATQALVVDEHSGILLTMKAFQYMGRLTKVSDGAQIESAAEALLKYMRETEGVSNIALFDEPDSDFHTFTCPRGYCRFTCES